MCYHMVVTVMVVMVVMDVMDVVGIDEDIDVGKNMKMVLDSHVTMVVRYLNANGNSLDNKIVKIEGEEYNAWETMIVI